MERGPLQNDKLVERLKGWIPVKLDANSTDGRLAGERYHIYGVPTIVIAKPNGDIKTSLEGVWAADAIQLAMDKAQPR